MERALCHLGEHPGHGIVSLLGVQLRHPDDVGAVARELAAQKEVHKVDLAENIDKVQDLDNAK